MKQWFFCIIIMTLPLMAQSHEGHVHGAGEAQPQKGGVIKSLETVHVELVQMGKSIRIYVFSKDDPPKQLSTNDYPVSAKVVYPRGKGETTVSLKTEKDHWSAKVDPKGLHRYDFFLNIEQGGHKDDLKFTIEPK